MYVLDNTIKVRMLKSIFATKIGMTQGWDTQGKRVAITKCQVQPNVILGSQDSKYLVGYGQKKLKNMTKPLRSIVEKSGFSFGVTQMKGVAAADENSELLSAGTLVSADQVVAVGDVVKVQGTIKGRGFAGGIKRYGFRGGPATHGQSDRARAVGSIGSGTTPGRVWKGKRMPGHYGNVTSTVRGLVVIHIDVQLGEIWLNGPIPGSVQSPVMISPIGEKKNVTLDKKASGIQETTPAIDEKKGEAPTTESETQA